MTTLSGGYTPAEVAALARFSFEGLRDFRHYLPFVDSRLLEASRVHLGNQEAPSEFWVCVAEENLGWGDNKNRLDPSTLPAFESWYRMRGWEVRTVGPNDPHQDGLARGYYLVFDGAVLKHAVEAAQIAVAVG